MTDAHSIVDPSLSVPTQPIAIDDVLAYLIAAAECREPECHQSPAD